MINPSEAKVQADTRMLPDHYRGCPYFGLPHDPDTRVMFPLESGTCHQAEPTGQVEISYQQTNCLSAQHQSCPVFLRHHKAPLPPEISGIDVKRSGSRRVLLGVFVIMLFAVVGAFVGLWWANSDGNIDALLPTTQEIGSDADADASSDDAALLVTVTETATAVLQTVAPEPTAVVILIEEATAVPTFTPLPTATATPALPATFTPVPATQTDVPTATAVANIIVDVVRLNVRLGPNTAYETVGLVDEGTEYDLIGRLRDNSWLQICCINGEAGWVIAEAVLVEGNLNLVPVVTEFPPLP